MPDARLARTRAAYQESTPIFAPCGCVLTHDEADGEDCRVLAYCERHWQLMIDALPQEPQMVSHAKQP